MSEKEFVCIIPDVDSAIQGEEIICVEYNGKKEEYRSHDYDKLYSVPGLYEHLFYDTFKCDSPNRVCTLLNEHLKNGNGNSGKIGEKPELTVLDLGAGNGMVGEKLREIGLAESLVGIDIIEEAEMALNRDRPGLYDDYYIADLTALPEPVEQKLDETGFNCLTTVAALGFGDIPPVAFANGYNFVEDSGWIAFNIKDEFLSSGDKSGFSRLIEEMAENGVMEMCARERYRHRFCQDGSELHYFAVVGQKMADIPEKMIEKYAV